MNFPPSIRYRLLAMAVLAIPVAASANQTPLVIDKAQSRLEIAVTATIDSFVARLQDFDAAITVDPASGRVGSASFQADFSAVRTGRTDRDRDMNAWQETGKFPRVAFDLAGLAATGRGEYTASVRLRLHGVERTVSFPVTIAIARGVVAIDGAASLDTRNFGLPVIRKYWLLTVNPVVTVRFHLQGRLPAL